MMKTSRNELVINAVEIVLRKLNEITPEDKKDLFERIRASSSRYPKIMQFRGDVSENPEFQTTFNRFYRVRKNLEWRVTFYKFFQKFRLNNKKKLDLKNILRHMHDFDGSWQYSFSTKMLHTLDDIQPIIDSRVLRLLNIPVRGERELQKLLEHYDMYYEIIYILLSKIEVKKILNEFDQALPELRAISEVKKLDFILWQFRN